MILDVEPQNLYLQANGGIFTKDDSGRAVECMIAYLSANYAGYEMYFTHTPEHISNRFLEANGAKLIEASVIYQMHSKDFRAASDADHIDLINRSDYEAYAAFHRQNFPDVYWSFERMYADLSKWEIFVMKHDAQIVGCAFASMWNHTTSEIYGLAFRQAFLTVDNVVQMLRAVATSLFHKGRRVLLYSIGEGEELPMEAAREAGFAVKDRYHCYKLKL